MKKNRGGWQLLSLMDIAQERLNDPRNQRKGPWTAMSLYKMRLLFLIEFIELQWEFIKWDLLTLASWFVHKEIERDINPSIDPGWIDKVKEKVKANIAHESGDVVNCVMFVNDKHGNLEDKDG